MGTPQREILRLIIPVNGKHEDAQIMPASCLSVCIWGRKHSSAISPTALGLDVALLAVYLALLVHDASAWK